MIQLCIRSTQLADSCLDNTSEQNSISVLDVLKVSKETFRTTLIQVQNSQKLTYSQQINIVKSWW